MKTTKERLAVTGKMTPGGANIAGIVLAVGAAVFLILTGAANLLSAL
ncbi:hypothetical protein [Pseudomonas sp. DG56-2]|nr:hypothetical protein [Pseudomonas sp. DG56-2]